MDPPVFILFLEGIVAAKIEAPHNTLCSPGVAQFLVDGSQEFFGEQFRATQQQNRPSSGEIRGAFTGLRFGDLSAPDFVRLFKQSQNALFYRLAIGKYPFCLIDVRGLLKQELQLMGNRSHPP
jgi:hypothetical protein